MSFRLLSISTMYPGSLNHFYQHNPGLENISGDDHLTLLMNQTTEFAGSYNKNFRLQGIEADCVIANDKLLQAKWRSEHGKRKIPDRVTLSAQVKHYQPEVLWIENLSLVDEAWLADTRNQVKSIRLVAGYHCSPINPAIRNSLTGVDIIITCTPGLKTLFESLGKRAFLVYHGFDAGISASLDSSISGYKTDLVFSGSLMTGDNYHQDRIRLIEEILERGIDLSLYANLESRTRIRAKQALYYANGLMNRIGMSVLADKVRILERGRTRIDYYSDTLLNKALPPLYGIDMYRLFQKSKVVLNYHIGVAGNYAGNMRMFEVTGVGSCLLTDNKKNINDLFLPGDEIVVYNNPEDCISKIKWLLDHDAERQKIALAGHERTIKCHTVASRCALIVEIIQNQLKKS
jgi:spore maturation protein CgeB